MVNKISKELIIFSEFIFKIYNFYLVSFNDFLEINLTSYDKVNDKFIFCILVRGIYLIEKIFIYNIYIKNYNIQILQNLSKKLIDLYFKFIEQLIAMTNNINLNIKDAEIFIYKKLIDKSINDFSNLTSTEKKYINIIKLNNSFLVYNINDYNKKNKISSSLKIDINVLLDYYKDFNYQVKII